MNDVLLFIMTYCKDMYYRHGFKFVDSGYCEGDNSYVTLRNADSDFMFIKDRGQLFLQRKNIYVNPHTGRPSGSFSITVGGKISRICLNSPDVVVWSAPE